MKRNKLNQIQTLSDNDDRSILNLLEVGDYVECYNGNKGTIICFNKNCSIKIVYENFVLDSHYMDIKSFIFVKSSWTREEVIELLNTVYSLGFKDRAYLGDGDRNAVSDFYNDSSKWINENL